MALLQEQKNFIESLYDLSPLQAQEAIKKENIRLYKGEYYKDGRGLLHAVFERWVNAPKEYQDMFLYILTQSSIGLADKKDNQKESVLDIMLNRFETFHDMSYRSLFIDLLLANQGKISSYQLSSILVKLVEKNDMTSYDRIFEIRSNDDTFSSFTLLQNLIKRDDIGRIEKFMQAYPDFKKNIKHQPFHDVTKSNQSEQSNYLIFALRHKAVEVVKYFIENEFGFPLNGRCTLRESGYSFNPYERNYLNNKKQDIKTATPALTEAIIQNLPELAKVIWEKTLPADILKSLNMQNHMGKSILAQAMQMQTFYPFLEKHIIDIFVSIDKEKNRSLQAEFTKTLLASTVSFGDIRSLYEKILDSQILQTNPSYEVNNLLQPFWLNVIERDNYTAEDKQNISLIYQASVKNVLDLWRPEGLYRPQLFLKPELIETLIQAGLNMSVAQNGQIKSVKTEFNVLEYYLKEYHGTVTHRLGKSTKPEELKVIYDNERESIGIITTYFPEMKTHEVFKSCLSKQSISIFDIFSDKEILSMSSAKEDSRGNFLYSLKMGKGNFLHHAFTRLVKLGLDPFHMEISDFYTQKEGQFIEDSYFPVNTLFENEFSFDYITDILNNHNPQKISVKELSNHVSFWKSIKSEVQMQYIMEQGANFDNPHVAEKLALHNTAMLAHYVDMGGAVLNKASPDTLLHKLIAQDKLEAAIILVQHCPVLTGVANKQKKLAISYLLPKLEKDAITFEKGQWRNNENMYTLTRLNFESEFIAKNPKAYEHLKEQLNKYSTILKIWPELQTSLNYAYLKGTTEKKEQNRTNRMKI